MESFAIFESDLTLAEVSDASLCKNSSVFEEFYLPSVSTDA